MFLPFEVRQSSPEVACAGLRPLLYGRDPLVNVMRSYYPGLLLTFVPEPLTKHTFRARDPLVFLIKFKDVSCR